MQTDIKMADEHSRLRTLRFYGFNQLKQHHSSMKALRAKAVDYRQRILQG
mgnify:CR=1 FL=1